MLALIIPAVLLLVLGLLWMWSPGTPQPFLDAQGKPLAGSVAEKIRISINGAEQGMFIKSRDTRNPVLLYLHGGMPDYFLTRQYPPGLEELFTVVWWEQRGSGLSCNAPVPADSLLLQQMIADTHELTRYLCRRFGKEKIYLMGHSGGTFIGIQAAARAPQLYEAYIGVAQIACQLRSECLAHEYMQRAYAAAGNESMLKKLREAPVTMEGGASEAWLAMRDASMHELGIGTMREMRSVITGIFLPSLQFREYTLGEKFALWRGKARSGVSVLWKQMLATDLKRQLTAVDLPVYFFHGRHDYTCSFALAREYFEALHAPVKQFHTFERSAHSPMFEEPEEMCRILLEEVLGRKSIQGRP